MIRIPLCSVEHGITNIPYVFVQNLLSKVFTLDSHYNRVIEGIVVNFKSLSLAPHIVKNTLDLIVGWRLAVEITYDEVFMNFSSFLENGIRYDDSGTTSRGNCDRS